MTDSTLGATMQGIAAESGKAMGSAVKGAGSTDNGGMSELFKLNQVWYALPPTLSLVAKRTVLINQAQQSTYQSPFNQNITFIFNTGEFFVSPTTSYLYLQLGYNNPTRYKNAKALISQGNVMQLFEEIVFTSASGTELCREQNKGLNHAITYRYTHTQEYINTYGQLQGAPTGDYSKIHDGCAPVFTRTIIGEDLPADTYFANLGGSEGLVHPRSGAAAKSYFGYGCSNLNITSTNDIAPETPTMRLLSVAIPLNELLGCFNPYMKSLLPAGFLAGGRLDIRLKDPTESIQFAGPCIESADPGTTVNTNLNNLIGEKRSAFNITQIYIGFDSYQMQDNVLKRLNQVSAGPDGLSLMFDTYDYTSTNKTGTGSIEAQVQQARSRIIRSYCVIRDEANTRNPWINSFASEACIRRACGMIQANSLSTKKVLGGNNQNFTGIGGGLTPAVFINTSTADGKYEWDTQTAADTKCLIIPFQEQPPLPADPYAVIPGGSYWGQPMVQYYQGQLGSLFFPQQPFTTPEEYYYNALYLFGKTMPDKDITCAVTFEDFLGGLGAGLYANGEPIDPTSNDQYGVWVAPYGLAVYGLLAEKSQALQLSGLPISNARLLRHRFSFSFAPLSGGERVIACFTEYTRLAKVFLGGRIVVRE